MMFPLQRITAPASSPVTLSETKKHLRVFYSDDDEVIQDYIDSAVHHFDGWRGLLGRCLITQTWQQHDRQFRRRYKSPFPDMSAVVVKYYDTAGDLQTVSSSNYVIEGEMVRFMSTYTLPDLYDERDYPVQIDWTCGFGSSVPEDIKTGIKMLVAHWYRNREAVVPNERRVEYNELPLGIKTFIDRNKARFVL